MPNWIGEKPSGFKDIPRYKKLYAINREGDIFSYPKYRWKGRVLKPSPIPSHKGFYMRICLTNGDTHRLEAIHRLLLETFRPNKLSAHLQVNHINGIKNDNRLENIEWCTASENIQHAVRTGLTTVSEKMRKNGRRQGKKTGAKNGLAVCRAIEQFTGKIFVEKYASALEASRKTGIKSRNINNALRMKTLNGKKKTAGGFYWSYLK